MSEESEELTRAQFKQGFNIGVGFMFAVLISSILWSILDTTWELIF